MKHLWKGVVKICDHPQGAPRIDYLVAHKVYYVLLWGYVFGTTVQTPRLQYYHGLTVQLAVMAHGAVPNALDLQR